MLQINHLTIIQTADQRILIEDLHFSLMPGQKLAVIGAEENGKSSLLRLIHSPEQVASYLTWQGEISYAPYRLAWLEQEASAEILASPIADLFAPHIGDAELYQLAAELLLDTEILFESRPLETASGGERLKLRLLLALLDQPDILLLDEPGNDLDLASLAWLENFLAKAPQAILYVSHDETLLARTATSILHIEQIWRRTEPRWTYSRLGFDQYMEQYRRGIDRQNALAAKEEQDYRNKMERYNEIRNKVDRDLNAVSRQDPATGRLLKKKMQSVKSMGRRFDREHERQTQRTDREEELEFFLDDLPGVPQDKEILRWGPNELQIGCKRLATDVELFVKGPERIGITGPNGSGKTTLLRQIFESFKDRTDVTAFYLPQNWTEEFLPGQYPLDYLVPNGERELLQEASNLLGSLKFVREEVERPIDQLSGGQKVKLLFAKLRLAKPQVLLLDEPTRHLSPLTNPVFRESLANYPGAIIAISHDRRFLAEVCTRVLRLTPQGLRTEDPALYSG